MVAVLADRALYRFTGGEPPTLDALRERYARQVGGRSPDGSQEWLNWVVRLRDDGRTAVGTVQATVTDDGAEAEVAWVIDTRRQGHGYGAEAAAAIVRALTDHGVRRVVAHIHPAHAASESVARRCGLTPTEDLHDGERRWEWVAP